MYKNQLSVLPLLVLIFVLPVTSQAETPSDEELLQLEQQIKQQEAEQEKARQRAVEEAQRRAEEQKLKEEQARLEEERRRLEEERQKIEAARQAEIERKRKEEEARKLAIEEQKRREEEAQKALVTLVFYRDQSFPFDGDSTIITHNGKEIGRLSSKSYFIYQTPPGEQIFKAVIFGDWTTEKAFELEPRSTQFIMTAIDWTTVGFSMQAAGPEVIARLENTGSLDPRRFFDNFDEVVNSSRQSSQSSGSTVIGR